MAKQTKAKKTTTKAPVAPKAPTRGIVIVAAGHPYYGHYAHNLAMSLKTTAPDIPITILHAGDGLQMINDAMRKVFDKIVKVPEKYYNQHGLPVWLRIKLCLDVLTPYDETIFLDADTICTPEKNVGDLFDLFAAGKVNFTVQNRGFVDIKGDFAGSNRWCDLKDVQKEYGEGMYHDIYTEFMYFKRCEEVTKLFKDALAVFDRPKIKYTNFAGTMADEMALAIAMLQNDVQPHQEKFIPIYWQARENRQLTPSQLHSGYYLYSVGGNHLTSQVRKVYDNLSIYYNNKFGVRFPWRVKEKRHDMPERHRI